MQSKFPYREAVVWLIGQPSSIQTLLRDSIHQKTGIKCRTAHSTDGLPWQERKLNTVWLILRDVQNYDPVQLEALVISCRNRRNCHQAMYNVSVEKKNAFERQAFEHGWHGVFHIDIGLEKMSCGIIDLLKGRLCFQRAALMNVNLSDRQRKARPNLCTEGLTKRERQVLCVIAGGATNREISDLLQISQHTVKTHVYNIYQKIKVSNRLQAAIWASANLGLR
jgi:LuxR family transcriptional regulator of csgAB operon